MQLHSQCLKFQAHVTEELKLVWIMITSYEQTLELSFGRGVL